MKKRTLTLLLIPFASLICSCSTIGAAEFTNYRKQNAITSVGTNYNLKSRQTKQQAVTIENDFYKIDGTTYASLLSNKIVKARSLTAHYLGNNIFYENNEYGGTFIDAFGDEIKFNLPTTNVETYTVYSVVSENSSFYRYVSGIKSSSTKLHFLECTKFKINKIDYHADYAYIVKEAGDTHFHARNVFIDDNTLFNFSANTYNLQTDAVVKLNASEYLIGNRHVYFSRFKNEDDKENKVNTKYNSLVVSGTRVTKQDSEYDCILTLPFAGSNYDYQYFIKEVTEGGVDYTVYSQDKYYHCYEYAGGKSYEVNFVPLDVKMSADYTEAYILCKRIKNQEYDRGKYVIKINYKGERSEFSKDTSIFEDKNPYYYFHDSYHELSDNTTIEFMDKEIIIANNGRDNIIVANDGYNAYLNNYFLFKDAQGEPYSFNKNYWFYNSYRGIAYFNKGSDSGITTLSGALLIDENNCLYERLGDIYFYNMKICSASEYKDCSFNTFVDFGKKSTVGVINTNSKSYILIFGE